MNNCGPIVKSEISREVVRRNKHKVALLLGYCGDQYYGSQYNEHHDLNLQIPTIEGELFRALSKSKLISELNAQKFSRIHLQRTTRTDKGVHALGNIISVKLLTNGYDELSIKDDINSNLPKDIKVWQVQRVNKNFNPRKACGSRRYEYIIPTYSFELGADKLDALLQLKLNGTFSTADLDIIKQYPTLSLKDYPHLTFGIKQYLMSAHNELTKYRLSIQRWNQFRTILKMFQGTHNFHNYTSMKTTKGIKDSNKRHIIDIDISKPYQISNRLGEWISIILEGQSFLLHQIRKMVSMSVMSMIHGFPSSYINESFEPQPMSIPKAPSLGLILQETKFTSYNKKLQQLGYDPISFDNCQDNLSEFKKNHILKRITQNETENLEFIKYLHYICYSKLADKSNLSKISDNNDQFSV
ncbi:tRNA pseudouridine(27/28) synthase [Monosporozyma unispora]